MLTGDKLETAINIGRASKLVEEEDHFAGLYTEEENPTEEEIRKFFAMVRHYVIWGDGGG